jgi:hypothetical protein
MSRQADLFQVILTLSLVRRFANLLDGRHEQADQYANDGDDNQ